ncbi:ABC transporter permease [bacterium]|nr:ABC transporter permease [bacterium]
MRTVLFIIKKEFIQFRRDRKMLALSFIAPVLQLLILAYAASLDVKTIPTVVCDQDRTRESRELAGSFFHAGYFADAGRAETAAAIGPLIDDGTAAIGIVIPRGFATGLAAGRPPQLQVIADGADANSAGIGLAYATQIVNRALLARQQRALAGRPAGLLVRIDSRPRVWYNPSLKSRNFMVPGVLGMLLMVMTMMLTSLGVVRERESGTMDQLLVTPIRPWQLIIGKLAPFAAIGLVDITLVVAVATLWFQVPLAGSLALLYGLSLLFILNTLGLGLLISTVSRNQQQAMMTAIFFIMMPMIILTGFVFPIENMPRAIQWATYLLPLRYYFVIIRGLFLKGVGVAELWPQGLALFAFGSAVLALSVLRFRRKLE